MEDLQIGQLVLDVQGVKSGLKSKEGALQGVVVDYYFSVEELAILAVVDWGNGAISNHHPEKLEAFDGEITLQ